MSTDPSSAARWWIVAVYVVLFGLSIPWYLPAGSLHTWVGLPVWVGLSVLATVGVATFTAFVIWRYWPEDDPPDCRAERS